jgi:ABC-type Zn uptake system ZnuABC Zn-binding protein ZnuA
MLRAVRSAVLLALLAALVIAGCSSSSGGGSGGLRVVATTTQVGDLTRQVAGGRAQVDQILQPGSDPHQYEPRPSDAEGIAQAKLVIRSGGDVDVWLGGVVSQAGGRARVVTLIDSVPRQGNDPHWWQNPRNGELAVAAIRDALVKADPGGAATYRRNAAAYIARLARLDSGIARCVARIPPRARRLVTSHDSLGYYARRYGFTIVGAAIPSLSSQAQPSAASTQRLITQIKHQHVPAIFPESALNPKLEHAIAREAHAAVAPPLWADALGPKRSSGSTYAGALSANTRTIVSALSRGRVNCTP